MITAEVGESKPQKDKHKLEVELADETIKIPFNFWNEEMKLAKKEWEGQVLYISKSPTRYIYIYKTKSLNFNPSSGANTTHVKRLVSGRIRHAQLPWK